MNVKRHMTYHKLSTTPVTMDVSRRLQLLLDVDELKSDTACTRQIVEAIRQLLCLDSDKKLELQQLIERIRQSWVQMLESVKRRRSVTSKLDKLYREFHEFSVGKGFRMCAASGQAIEIEVPETLWQLLLEKEFTSFLSTTFGTAADTQTGTDQATSRTLTDIEENVVDKNDVNSFSSSSCHNVSGTSISIACPLAAHIRKPFPTENS